jgi:hypothetical protein
MGKQDMCLLHLTLEWLEWNQFVAFNSSLYGARGKQKTTVTPEDVLKELHPVPRAGVTACQKHIVQHEQHVADVEPLACLVLDRVELPRTILLKRVSHQLC